ncbi:S1 family peptidase [Glaciecola sp. 1036]|uniref:S1 family peptidase n=1 Tax=Alteromonadaceae TaxID=72275 RepID=UPI003D05B98B
MGTYNLILHYLSQTFNKGFNTAILLFVCLFFQTDATASLVEKVKQTSSSVVAIGLSTPIESDKPVLLGTGFVVGNGKYVVTNYHVVSKELETQIVQRYVAMSGSGQIIGVHPLEILGIDPVHDLAILKITDNSKLPSLELNNNDLLDAGTDVYFTGFPIGAVLGLYPASHRGMIAAIAPDVNPARNANELTLKMLKRLKQPFMIYQLDATAYPGNSGSPVFNVDTNTVIGIINKVFVSGGKEAALSNPSGISYAIPVRHLRKLALDNGLRL